MTSVSRLGASSQWRIALSNSQEPETGRSFQQQLVVRLGDLALSGLPGSMGSLIGREDISWHTDVV